MHCRPLSRRLNRRRLAVILLSRRRRRREKSWLSRDPAAKILSRRLRENAANRKKFCNNGLCD